MHNAEERPDFAEINEELQSKVRMLSGPRNLRMLRWRGWMPSIKPMYHVNCYKCMFLIFICLSHCFPVIYALFAVCVYRFWHRLFDTNGSWPVKISKFQLVTSLHVARRDWSGYAHLIAYGSILIDWSLGISVFCMGSDISYSLSIELMPCWIRIQCTFNTLDKKSAY